MKSLYYAVHYLGRAILPPISACQVFGREHIPARGPYLLISNHRSNLDVMFITSFVPHVIHWMAKIELWRNPLTAIPIRVFEAFPVRRGTSDIHALRTASALLAAGEVVGIFPEGRRSRSGGLQAGNLGAALIALRANVPVLPVAISGTGRYWPGDATPRARGRIRLQFGPPFVLERSQRHITHADLQRGHAIMMRAIAAMLPPEQRGVWAGTTDPLLVSERADDGPPPTTEKVRQTG